MSRHTLVYHIWLFIWKYINFFCWYYRNVTQIMYGLYYNNNWREFQKILFCLFSLFRISSKINFSNKSGLSEEIRVNDWLESNLLVTRYLNVELISGSEDFTFNIALTRWSVCCEKVVWLDESSLDASE